ncbi:MAG TPA: lysylphosphatidylglycerol synthase transmembrane domain-containing protein [Thermoanaerobaculia bacterium]|jgi:hypothetical protein
MEPGGLPRPARQPGRSALRLALAAAGVALLVWLFRTVGWSAIEENLRNIGALFFVVVALYGLAQVAFFLGWWVVMDPRPAASRLPGLFGVYLAGDAANYVSPGGVAGEPLKVRFLSDSLGAGPALASVTLHKQVDLIAQVAFVLAGVGVALARFPMSSAARAGALAGVGLLGAMLGGLSWALRRGTYGGAVAWLSRFRIFSRLLRHREQARAVDTSIRRFHDERRGAFAAGIALCFLGWCGGAVETGIVLHRLAPGGGWARALGIEALTNVAVTMLLFLPGRIGGAEGARAGICVLLGLSPAQGVAYGLVRRAREIAWALPGLLVIFARTLRPHRADAPLAKLARGEARP